MTKNINDASLANLTHYQGKWKHGATRTIRVPITLADDILEYARQLDSGVKSLDTGESGTTKEIERDNGVKSLDTNDLADAEEVEQDNNNQSVAEWEDFLESLDTSVLTSNLLKAKLKGGGKVTVKDVKWIVNKIKESWLHSRGN